MARIRTIKPEFPQSESMGRVSRESRLCFILIWTIADDSGRLRGNSRMLASLLYPYDDDAKGHIDTWLAELETEHCIRRYEANGDSYIEVCNWLQHQKIDKPSKSKFPSFDDSSRIVANPREGSSEDQGSRTKDQGPKEGSTPPAEKQFNPVEVAIVICRELGFAGRDIRLLIEEQITNEMHRLPGTNAQQVGQTMADQWRLYQRSAEWKTQFKKSPKSFFSSPAWKDSPDQWERNSGKPAVSAQVARVNRNRTRLVNAFAAGSNQHDRPGGDGDAARTDGSTGRVVEGEARTIPGRGD